MAVFFLDNDQKVIKIVPDDGAISILQTQELPGSDGLLKDTLYVRLKNDQRLFDAQYMAVKSYGDNRNAFDLYRIVNEIVPDNATEFEGVQLAPYELEGVVIEDLRPQNRPLNQMVNQLLENTDWRLGYMDDNLPAVSTNFYYVSVKDALKKIQDLLNIEFLFKVEISGNEITDKWVEVYREVGNRTLKRFNYGTNALTVKRETSSNELYTALIGRGKGEEVSSAEDNPGGQAGYGRKITFEDVEWSRENGDPADKPKGQKYIEFPQATEEYGIKLIDGRKVPRVGVVEFSDTEEPEVLINQTWQELQYYARPRVLFSTTVAKIGGTSIGDTVTIHRHDLNMHYMTRVRKVVRNRKNDKQTQLEIGDVVHTPSTKRQGQINSALNNVTSDLENVRGEVTEARHSADGKNTNFYGNVEPDRKKVGDTWFRDHPSLTGESQVLVWNGEAWELIMDTSETTKNADAIKEQQKEIDAAKEVADEALSEIDVAIRNAGFTSLDDTIKNVQLRANTAFDTANDLIGEVSGYSQTVDGFNQTVNNYTDQVANFRSDVNGFSSTVASYSADVRGYATQVSTLTNRVDGFNSTVANIDGRVSTLSNTIDGISSTVIGYDGRISTVEQLATGLQTTVSSKASQSQVTQLSNAYNVFVGGIEDRKNLLPGMEHGSISSYTGDEHSISGYVRSPYIPVEPSSYYIASLDRSPVSFAIYSYSDIGQFISASSQNTSYKYVGANVKYVRVVMYNSNPDLKYQLEKGFVVTDYVPFIGDVSSAQISMLQNNINLRVTSTELNNAVSGKADKNRLITQINLSSDTALIQSENILLDGDVTVRGTAWMDGAVLKDLSVDGAKIQDATIGDAKIANLDVGKISGNTTEFVQSTWNSATGGSVQATGDGIVATASDDSQVLIQNGVMMARNPGGASLGTIGYRYMDGSPYFNVHTTLGAHFSISARDWDGRDKLMIEVSPDKDGTIIHHRLRIMGSLNFNFDHYISHTNNRISITGRESVALRANESTVFSVSNDGTNNFASMHANLNMNGSNVINQSDARLKTDISTRQESSLEKINRFNFVDFTWIKDDKSDFGVIAQQVQQVAPELILEGSDGYLSLNNSLLNMMTSHGLQELSHKHDTTAQLAESNEQKIHRLQQELSKANRRIEELERVMYI